MLAYTYLGPGKFALLDKPRPTLLHARDAIVRVTLGSICTSDLHIKHGSVPRAVPGVTVGHEMVGVVEEVGAGVTAVRPGDRVAVNVETFCGDCFFCRNGWVNNCTDPDGGWALGCRIDGGQAEYVRVPYADQGLSRIPDGVSDLQALLVGDVLATGYWAADIAEIHPGDTVLILGAGPTGICTLQCVRLKTPGRIIVCDADPRRLDFVRRHYPEVIAAAPEQVLETVAVPQRPRRRRRGAGGGRHAGDLPHGLDVRPAQRRGDGGGPVRRPPGAAPAGDVRQKPDLQDRRRGRLPVRRDPGPHRGGPAGHHAPHHPHLPPGGHRGRL